MFGNFFGDWFSDSISSAVIGIASVVVGFAVFPFFGARLGPSAVGSIIALTGIVFFAISLVFKRK